MTLDYTCLSIVIEADRKLIYLVIYSFVRDLKTKRYIIHIVDEGYLQLHFCNQVIMIIYLE